MADSLTLMFTFIHPTLLKHHLLTYNNQKICSAIAQAINGLDDASCYLHDDTFVAINLAAKLILKEQLILFRSVLTDEQQQIGQLEPIMCGINESTLQMIASTSDEATQESTVVAGCMVRLEFFIHTYRCLISRSVKSEFKHRVPAYKDSLVMYLLLYSQFAEQVKKTAGLHAPVDC